MGKKNIKNGFYIVVEGMDGTGKTTACQMIKEYFKSKGFDPICIREPGGTPLGEKLRDILKSDCEICKDAQLLMMMAAREQLMNDVVYPIRNKIIISDRNWLSSVVYQQCPLSLLAENGQLNTPDLLIIMNMPLEVAIKRRANDDRFETLDMKELERIASDYREYSKGRLKVIGDRIYGVDASQSLDKVKQDIYQILDNSIDFDETCN